MIEWNSDIYAAPYGEELLIWCECRVEVAILFRIKGRKPEWQNDSGAWVIDAFSHWAHINPPKTSAMFATEKDAM